MKKSVCMLVVIAIAVFAIKSANAQVIPSIAWQKSLGGSSDDIANSIQVTSDGNYIIAGGTRSNNGDVTGNHGNEDFWIVKLNVNGAVIWQKCFGGSNDEEANSIVQTSDGGYIVEGWTYSNDGNVTGNHGNMDFWIVKLNSSGNMLWQKCFGGDNEDVGYQVQQTIDGGYILSGNTRSNNGDVSGIHNNGVRDIWVVKINNVGSIEWQKCFGGNDEEYFNANSIQQTTDGSYIFNGYTWSSNSGDVGQIHGADDYWTVKTNANGTIIWQKSLGGSSNDGGYAIDLTSDGGYIDAGACYSTDGDVTGGHGVSDCWIAKLNTAGSIDWQRPFGGEDDERPYDIKQTSDGGYIFTGFTRSLHGDVVGNHPTPYTSDFWVVKLDNAGNLSWQKCLGGFGDDEARSIQQTAAGELLITGYSTSNDGDVSGNHGGRDCWVVKLAPPDNPQNTSYGTNALNSNSSGLYNSAFGYYSLYKNTSGNNNSAFGYYSLYSNSSGKSNIAFGSQALYSNTNGIENTALGTFALLKNTSGSQNTANGANALYANTTGNYNTASGAAALTSNKTGSNNTASGFSALTSNTTGNANTATGYLSLSENTGGKGNTGMGWSALSNNATGSYNTALGNNANTSLADLTNSTALGRASLVTASNQVRIGNVGVTSIGGYTNWSNISDGRYKKNLKENVPGLKFINALRPVTYNLQVTELDVFLQRDMQKTGKNNESLSQQAEVDKKATAEKEKIIYTGFIAQEVEKAAKEIGYDFSGVDAPKNDHDAYALRYAEFVVPLVKAVQELSQQHDQLTNEITEIKKTIAAIQQNCNNRIMPYSAQINGNLSDERSSVSISPNPVRSFLTVSIRDNHVNPVITALDMYGKVLFIRPATQNQTKLDVSKLTAGTYIIKISDAGGNQLYSGKFVKQN